MLSWYYCTSFRFIQLQRMDEQEKAFHGQTTAEFNFFLLFTN